MRETLWCTVVVSGWIKLLHFQFCCLNFNNIRQLKHLCNLPVVMQILNMHVFQNLILLWGRIPTPEWEEAAGCEKTSHLQNHRSTNSHSHRQRQSWEYSFWISLLLRPLSIIKVTHEQLWNWHLQWIWHGAVTTMVRCNGKTQLYDAIVRCNCMMQLYDAMVRWHSLSSFQSRCSAFCLLRFLSLLENSGPSQMHRRYSNLTWG